LSSALTHIVFEKKTLIVIGAGASSECQLPTGVELTREIANLLDFSIQYGEQKRGDHLIVKACGKLAKCLSKTLIVG
jgi:hypothetical protein